MTSQLSNLKIHTLRIFSGLDDSDHGGYFSEVQSLIDKIRRSLTTPGQQLGAWEALEMNLAARALSAGFPKLALISAGKAMAVHQLPEAEYAFGFDSAQVRTDAAAWNNGVLMDDAISRAETARDLSANQKEAAQTLERTEEGAARTLKGIEKTTAEVLDSSQRVAALTLLKEDKDFADSLFKAQECGMEKLKTDSEKTIIQQHEREQALAWMSGGYSVGGPALDLSSENPYLAMSDAQKFSALDLKVRQNKTAADLKESQLKTASNLKESEKVSAAGLKTEQQQAATNLRESQTVSAIREEKAGQTISDTDA